MNRESTSSPPASPSALTAEQIDEAALAGFLAWLTEPLLAAKAAGVLVDGRARTIKEIGAAIGMPPAALKAAVAALAEMIRVQTTQKVAEIRARKAEEKSGKAVLSEIVSAAPIDLAMTETLKKFVSVSFQNRALALLENGGPREVGEIAALLGLQNVSIQMELAAELVKITGEPVQVPLGRAGNGATIEIKPENSGRILN